MRTRLLALALVSGALYGGNWLTFNHDPQRTGWAKEEDSISTENVSKLHLDWSVKLDNQSKELNALTVPLIIGQAITPKGFKDILVVAGASDTLYAIDADQGKIIWQRKFHIEGQPKNPNGGWLCPNSLNATPVLDPATHSVYALASDGKLHTMNYISGEDQKPPVQFVPPFAKAWSLNLFKGSLYTTTSQGCNGVRSAVYVMDVKSPDRPIKTFVAGPTGGAGMWGRAGGAISAATGLIYAETGDGPYDVATGKYSDTFLAVTADGKLADYYTPANRKWITHKDLDMGNMSPLVFPYDKWELVAGAGKEGVLYLLDAKNLGGADHHTPLFRSSLVTNEDVDFAGRGFWGALATSEDSKGNRWLFAPALGPLHTQAEKFPVSYGPAPAGSIMAFKVATKEGKPVLEPAWMSRNLAVPEPPIVANGIVFALSNGENTRQVDASGRLYTSEERAKAPTGNSVLYAFDAQTGKELFSSGKTMPAFTHFSGLAISNGRVFAVTYDNTVYAFGLPE